MRSTMTDAIRLFGEGERRDDAVQRLGVKGAGLDSMARLGMPVPAGFTIPTTECARYLARREHGLEPELIERIDEALAHLEQRVGRRFGDDRAPLLVSVRSGAATSMPGMLETILDVGLTRESLEGLAAMHGGNRTFALDSYRRLLQMFGHVALGVSSSELETIVEEERLLAAGPERVAKPLGADALSRVVDRLERRLRDQDGVGLPADPRAQLHASVEAVFRSWNSPRALRYRKSERIVDAHGTACTIQAMVFGNLDARGGSGVLISRHPVSGEKRLYGEYLARAQGEDVVAGMRTPEPLCAAEAVPGREGATLELSEPEAFRELQRMTAELEAHFGDVQEIEFTLEDGKPHLLQTRPAKRSARAAVRIAVDLVREGRISIDEALLRVDAASLERLFRPRVEGPEALAERGIVPLGRGLPASPGAAIGEIVFDAETAIKRSAEGREVILVRRETSPEDVHGMKAAEGIVTAGGGMTSHAAVVARGLGKPSIVGCGVLDVDPDKGEVRVPGASMTLREGDVVTVDGTTGAIYAGALPVVAASALAELDTLLAWADERRRLRVRANADTGRQVTLAMALGAEGVGLCRIEPMFFAEDRLGWIRAILLADDPDDEGDELVLLERALVADLRQVFEAASGSPVTVRLLDWPLHEFMPAEASERAALARSLGITSASLERRITKLHEVNPMLGHRGVRVAVTHPSLYRAQIRAILRAADEATHPFPAEILVPMVSAEGEMHLLGTMAVDEAERLGASLGRVPEFRLGALIELPRACLVADAIAGECDFFSFGTNDLTQTTLGFSRDDAGGFLSAYGIELGILDGDPFSRLDRRGVGRLLAIATTEARNSKENFTIAMCGEHGGEPSSIDECERLGLDYVSCAPPRIPAARLAAAQACILHSRT
jgi:pyruvate, orthophosphate dikinase